MYTAIKSIGKVVIKKIANLSPVFVTKLLFHHYMGERLDLNNPITLNEKMQWLKLFYYNNNPLVTKCVDKYLVREYVKECGCEELLVNLIGVWNTPEEIDFDTLPNQFVLKCNHGSGSVIICRDKNKLDRTDVKEKLNKWLKEDFGKERAELSYQDVKRCIVCEELIKTDNNKAPNDYKFFCSYGKPKFLFCATERNGEHAYFDFYDLNWNHYDVTNSHPNSSVPVDIPPHFREMMDAASKLSKDFPLVRVDLYDENGKVMFGELTFLHFGGLHPFNPREFDKIFGDMFDISDLVNNMKHK